VRGSGASAAVHHGGTEDTEGSGTVEMVELIHHEGTKDTKNTKKNNKNNKKQNNRIVVGSVPLRALRVLRVFVVNF
jgi:hypothetical protein